VGSFNTADCCIFKGERFQTKDREKVVVVPKMHVVGHILATLICLVGAGAWASEGRNMVMVLATLQVKSRW
jgi:hypothetical protein